MRLIGAALALPLLLGATGCFPWWLFGDDDDDFIPPPPPQQPLEPTVSDFAPSLEIIAPQWPPISETSVIEFRCQDDVGLATLDVQFAERIILPLSSTSDQVFLLGEELGEGFGTLSVVVTDVFSNRAHRQIENFLVDLSPPEATFGPRILRHGQPFELWVADAWVLGAARMKVGEAVFEKVFEPGYPTTLGVTWDLALVKFPTEALPPGIQMATVEIVDAAGHVTVEVVELNLDADPPTVSIDAPAPNAVVSGAFEIVVSAADLGGGPTWIDVSLDGTPVGTGVGPQASITVDASDLIAGPALLVATARDQAGHETTTERTIEIASP